MVPVLYVLKFDDSTIDKAVQRLNNSLENLLPQADRIYILNASNKDLKINREKITYLYKPHKGYFNKSILINYSVKNFLQDYEYFIFSDIDLVYESNYVNRMNEYVKNNQTPIRVIPHNTNLNIECYSSDFNHLKDVYSITGSMSKGWSHGNGLIHTKSFMQIKGYNESYLGYSPEDQDFNMRIGKINKLIYDENLLDFHLWHPQVNREHVRNNEMIYKQYKVEIEQGRLVFNGNIWGEY
jgi:hypothetical protein